MCLFFLKNIFKNFWDKFVLKCFFLNKFVLKIPDDEFWDLIKFGK